MRIRTSFLFPLIVVVSLCLRLLTFAPPLALANGTTSMHPPGSPLSSSAKSAVSSQGAQTNWHQFGFDQQHTHYNPYETVLNPKDVSHLVPAWTHNTHNPGDQTGTFAPAVVNGIVYIGSTNHKLYALDALTGIPRWVFTASGSFDSSPSVINNSVYIGNNNGKLYTLNATTGSMLWSVSIGFPLVSSPNVTHGIVYIGANKLYAFNEKTGKKLWSSLLNGGTNSSPAVSSDLIYVVGGNYWLYAFNATTGKKFWVRQIGAYVPSSPAVANGGVYIGAFDHDYYKLFAFNATTGKRLWIADVGGAENSSPAVANGVVYMGGGYPGFSFYAFNAKTGSPIWVRTLQGTAVLSSAAVANGVVYVGDGVYNNGILQALDAKTGSTLYSFSAGGQYVYDPVVVNGMVYFQVYAGKFYALHLPG